MHNLKQTLIIFCIGTATAGPITAQPDNLLSCYQYLLQEGERYTRNRQYAEAISQYWAAFDCDSLPADNILEARIKSVQTRWFSDLEQQIEKAREARQAALAAKKEAEDAKEKEAEAKALAQQKAAEAKRRGKQAEAMRLSLLSDKARAAGQHSTALALAYLSLEMWPDDSLSSKMRAFSAAARDSLERAYMKPRGRVHAILPLPGAGLMSISEVQAIYVPEGGGAPKALPDAFAKARSVSISEEGKAALLLLEGEEVAKWESSDSVEISRWAAHRGRVLGGTLSNQGIITYSSDHTAKVWKLSGKPQLTLSGHEGGVYEAGFSPVPGRLFTRSSDGTVRIWDSAGNCLLIIRDEKGYFYQVEFSTSGKQFLTAGASGKATVWSTDGKPLEVYRNDDGPVLEAHFLPEVQQLITRTPQTVRIWNRSNGALTFESQPGAEGMQWVEANQTLIIWFRQGDLQIWQPGKDLKILSGHSSSIIQIDFSPVENQLLSTSRDGTTRLWDQQGNNILTWNLQSKTPQPAFFSTDSRFIFTIQEDNQAVYSCINPAVAYKQMTEQESEWAPKFSSLRKKYQLLYWE